MEKIVIACCGTYLANTRIENVLADHEIYSLGMVKYWEVITFMGKETSLIQQKHYKVFK